MYSRIIVTVLLALALLLPPFLSVEAQEKGGTAQESSGGAVHDFFSAVGHALLEITGGTDGAVHQFFSTAGHLFNQAMGGDQGQIHQAASQFGQTINQADSQITGSFSNTLQMPGQSPSDANQGGSNLGNRDGEGFLAAIDRGATDTWGNVVEQAGVSSDLRPEAGGPGVITRIDRAATDFWTGVLGLRDNSETATNEPQRGFLENVDRAATGFWSNLLGLNQSDGTIANNSGAKGAELGDLSYPTPAPDKTVAIEGSAQGGIQQNNSSVGTRPTTDNAPKLTFPTDSAVPSRVEQASQALQTAAIKNDIQNAVSGVKDVSGSGNSAAVDTNNASQPNRNTPISNFIGGVLDAFGIGDRSQAESKTGPAYDAALDAKIDAVLGGSSVNTSGNITGGSFFNDIKSVGSDVKDGAGSGVGGAVSDLFGSIKDAVSGVKDNSTPTNPDAGPKNVGGGASAGSGGTPIGGSASSGGVGGHASLGGLGGSTGGAFGKGCQYFGRLCISDND